MDWIYDLSQTKVIGLNIPNALGINGFGDLDLFILESMLKNMSDEEIRQTLKTEYGMNDTENLGQTFADKKQNIQQSIICQPLFD